MIHIHPKDDLKEHLLEGATCECEPSVITEDEILVVHNSYDGREIIERVEQILQSNEKI